MDVGHVFMDAGHVFMDVGHVFMDVALTWVVSSALRFPLMSRRHSRFKQTASAHIHVYYIFNGLVNV
jgi:hypothetical protein